MPLTASVATRRVATEMALSDDQKAILRLLSQRGEQGYDDLAALMGIGVGEVHERALAAAAQLESEGIPAPAIPAPPAGAQSEPSAAAPAASGPEAPSTTGLSAEPPAEPEPMSSVSAKPEPAAPPAASKSAGSAGRPKLSLPKSGGARAALAAGAAVVVLLVVILALGGGGGSDDSPSGSGSAGPETATNASTNPKLTQAVLSPIDGSEAKGLATFGRVKNRLALQVEAEGLEPTGKGESYTIWLYESADKMLPLASTAVGDSGKIGAQIEVPTEVLGYLANETFDQIDVSLTSNATLKASLAKATKEKEAPIYTGTDVLRGEITGPIIGAAKKANGE